MQKVKRSTCCCCCWFFRDGSMDDAIVNSIIHNWGLSVEEFGFLSSLDWVGWLIVKFWRLLIGLGSFGTVWDWARLGSFEIGVVWDRGRLGSFGIGLVWARLGSFGLVWARLGSFGIVWDWDGIWWCADGGFVDVVQKLKGMFKDRYGSLESVHKESQGIIWKCQRILLESHWIRSDPTAWFRIPSKPFQIP